MAAPIPLRSDAPMSTTTVPVNPRASPRQAKSLTSPKPRTSFLNAAPPSTPTMSMTPPPTSAPRRGCISPLWYRMNPNAEIASMMTICKPDDQQSPACKKSRRRELHVKKRQPDQKAAESRRIDPSPRKALDPLDMRICKLRRRLCIIIGKPGCRHFIKYVHRAKSCQDTQHKRCRDLDQYRNHIFPHFQFIVSISGKYYNTYLRDLSNRVGI